jgi:TetR/AcrR family transcriptional repressor of nem operon
VWWAGFCLYPTGAGLGGGEPARPVVCLVGMLSQEMAATHPEMRAACVEHLNAWIAMVTRMLAAAKKAHRPAIDFDPESVASMLYSLWQGSMLISKAQQRPDLILEALRHGRDYVDGLFGTRTRRKRDDGC